jgi:hypothetical protein
MCERCRLWQQNPPAAPKNPLAGLAEKPKIRGKPQIPQISQMTETKDFGFIRRKNASGTKM